ncbi:unnamed protein product, partial [Musa textilis]
GERTITDRTTTRRGEARKKNGVPVVTVSISRSSTPPRVLRGGVLLERFAGVSRRSVPVPRKPWRSPREGTPRSLRFHPGASGIWHSLVSKFPLLILFGWVSDSWYSSCCFCVGFMPTPSSMGLD